MLCRASAREALDDPEVVVQVRLHLVDGLEADAVVGDLNVEGHDDAGRRAQDPGAPGREVRRRVDP